MTVKKARQLMAQALKDDPQFMWDYQSALANMIMEDQKHPDRSDLKSFPGAFTFARRLINVIFGF